ncbi:MAG: PAS domain-containing protein [Desulfomonile tiedjei]|nr:PAS domain-containing protein [Desulfomonile tiedjei]
MTRPRGPAKERDLEEDALQTPLKVLIIGGNEALEKSRDILESLKTMGFNLDPVGIVYRGTNDRSQLPEISSDLPIYDEYTSLIQEQKPDLLIVTSHDHELRKHVMNIIPSETRILGSFAVDVLQTLKTVAGQLGTTQDRLQSVELIKEVLMAGSEVSIMVVDEDFKVLDINRAILDRTKMSAEACLNRPCHWVIHRYMEPCHLKGMNCSVLEVLRTGRSTHSVREETRTDGTNRYFTVSTYPMKENAEGKKSVLIVWKDVTKGMTPVLDRKAHSITRDFSHVVHQDKMVALGKLAAAAVHEINNPIQGILIFSKIMRTGLDRDALSAEELDKFKNYLDLIAEESARCGQILRNLLSFARQDDLEKSFFNLGTMLQEIFLLIGNRMELQNIKLDRRIAENLPAVFGDRNRLKQALLNLVLNAVEAMPDGGTISLSVDLYPDSEHLRIRVGDTGHGIPKQLHGSMFEPFVTTKEHGKGVGLGLSVVYGVIAQHGGNVEVESEEGKGAFFTLTLPISKKDLEESAG